MANPLPLAPQLGCCAASAAVLTQWRGAGPDAALQEWIRQTSAPARAEHDPLLQELGRRLQGQPGPRLLVDGVWFSRPHGGITRVWEQIMHTWNLPGMLTPQAPVGLVERISKVAIPAAMAVLECEAVDPLDPQAVANVAGLNRSWVQEWGAEVFLSSWISSSAPATPACPELALVHDCLPERYGVPEPLKLLRQRWLQGAAAHLAVSASTAADLEVLLSQEQRSVPWCHPAPADLFAATVADPAAERLWQRLQQKASLRPPYVLLPATSAIGSYKNPELLAQALTAPALQPLQLVLCGIGADQRRQELEARFPALQGRCVAAGFTDLELALAYRQALAVVIPSHAEGFGLPAIEAMASGATVLVADSRGLREAGAGAALRFGSRQPGQLVALLQLVQELALLPSAGDGLAPHLERRRQQRLRALHPDLLGLALLAMARRLAS